MVFFGKVFYKLFFVGKHIYKWRVFSNKACLITAGWVEKEVVGNSHSFWKDRSRCDGLDGMFWTPNFLVVVGQIFRLFQFNLPSHKFHGYAILALTKQFHLPCAASWYCDEPWICLKHGPTISPADPRSLDLRSRWGTSPPQLTRKGVNVKVSRRPGPLAKVFKSTSYTLMARP